MKKQDVAFAAAMTGKDFELTEYHAKEARDIFDAGVAFAIKQSLAHPQSRNINKTDSLRAEWGLRTLEPEVKPNLQPQAPVVPEGCGYCAKGVCYKHGEDAATEPSQRDDLRDDLRDFEAWAQTNDGNCSATYGDLDKLPEGHEDGMFKNPLVERDWTVWQACAASKGKS